MRQKTLVAGLLACNLAIAQDGFKDILIADPFSSNGYFIVNDAKRLQLGVANVVVDVIVESPQENSSPLRTIVQTLTIPATEFFGRADLSSIGTIDPGEFVLYHLTARKGDGVIVVDYEDCNNCQRSEGQIAWPAICRQTCNAAANAWSLVAYGDNVEAFIDIQNGTQNGSLFYFYVTNWGSFTSQYQASDFGLPGYWSNYPSNTAPQNDYVRFFDGSSEHPCPPQAKDYLGYNLPANPGPCYGVRKDLGPWRGLSASTDEMSRGLLCVNQGEILSRYNSDDYVQGALLDAYMDPLYCGGIISDGNGGAVEWGNPDANLCTQISFDNSNTLDPIGWVMETVECPDYAIGNKSLSAVSSILIDHVLATQVERVLTIPIPDVNDTKLVPVERTGMEAGLYEFTIVFDDGSLIQHYQHFDQSVSVSADFAAFTEVSVYPVPVTSTTFAVDLDILTPMSIGLTIVNNQGTVYYTKSLNFGLAGLNKHVVRMNTQWPQGIYHCVFQYPDGSGESLSISVE